MNSGAFPGQRYAMHVIHPGSPVLRIRYRSGVLVAPSGVPDWLLYARAMVDLPPVPAGLTRDEARVVDVLTANELMVAAGDPSWEFTRADYAARTPPGWTWAHLVTDRRLALVPADLHASYRHIGGVNMLRGSASGYGLRVEARPRSVPVRITESLSEALAAELEEHLGYPLPPRYREFLVDTNGLAPTEPGVLDDFGFVVDQPWFGLSREDRQQDLIYANNWFGDRFTADFLAVAPVQGGLLAVKVRGDDADSIWYWDDDDPRDDDAHDAAYISANLLYRVADDVSQLWAELALPAADLLAVVDDLVRDGTAGEVRPDLMGAWLPANRRASWQTGGATGVGDDVLAEFDATKG
jgi:A nuclease of the HNH/ENDO VII superfamily with conserved WHH/SMI1 / KNR4 family (SUKH-1)